MLSPRILIIYSGNLQTPYLNQHSLSMRRRWRRKINNLNPLGFTPYCRASH